MARYPGRVGGEDEQVRGPRGGSFRADEEQSVGKVLEHDRRTPCPEIQEHGGPVRPYERQIGAHALEVRADVRGEIDLVHDEEIGPDHPEAALSRDVVPGSDVDDVEPVVDEIRAEGRSKVVAT